MQKRNLWSASFLFGRCMCILNLSQTLLGIVWLKYEIYNLVSLSKMSPERRAFLPFLRRKLITLWVRTQKICLSCKWEWNRSPFIKYWFIVWRSPGREQTSQSDGLEGCWEHSSPNFYNLVEEDVNIFCRKYSKRLSRYNFKNRRQPLSLSNSYTHSLSQIRVLSIFFYFEKH